MMLWRSLECCRGRLLGVGLAPLARRSLGRVFVCGLAPEGPPEVDSILKPPPNCMASFEKFNLGKWAQPLGDLDFQTAF